MRNKLKTIIVKKVMLNGNLEILTREEDWASRMLAKAIKEIRVNNPRHFHAPVKVSDFEFLKMDQEGSYKFRTKVTGQEITLTSGGEIIVLDMNKLLPWN